MRATEIFGYIEKLFSDGTTVCLSVFGTLAYRFLFPDSRYLAWAIAELIIMILDLLTKLFALSRQNGGLRAAIKGHKIISSAFAKGTTDKLLVFGVMLVICGCAYRLSIIEDIANWFAQIVFALMFFRDMLSILENLRDAGIQGLGVFERVVKKKMSEYVDDEGDDEK